METPTSISRRLAGAVCLAAFALLLFISNAHTHGLLAEHAGVAICAQQDENHCAACEILARDSGLARFDPAIVAKPGLILQYCAPYPDEPTFTLFIFASRSRAPPEA